jgi:hypothetical protein
MAIAQSGKLVVDQDIRNGKTGPTTFEEAVWILGDKIRATPAQRTGSGGFQHIYDGTGLPADFTNPPELAKGGIDIKRNGHVILPPSFNDSGQYEWLEAASLDDLKPQSHAVLAPLLKEGAITRLCIGPVTNRDDETYRFCRNVKLLAKSAS